MLAAMLSALSAIWWRWRLRGPQWIDAPRSDRHHRDATSKAGGPTWLTGFLVGAIGIWLLRFPREWIQADTRSRRSRARGRRCGRRAGIHSSETWTTGPPSLAGDPADYSRRRRLGVLRRGAGPVAGPAWLWLGAALVLQLALGIFDNMDGTLAAVCTVGLCALGVIPGLRVAWVAMGATVGFLLWNRPPARLFLGNRGSQPSPQPRPSSLSGSCVPAVSVVGDGGVRVAALRSHASPSVGSAPASIRGMVDGTTPACVGAPLGIRSFRVDRRGDERRARALDRARRAVTAAGRTRGSALTCP
ncbi:MAG: hypothetical protein R3E12_06345 [Candidatus Eisenbacteria bacterium]